MNDKTKEFSAASSGIKETRRGFFVLLTLSLSLTGVWLMVKNLRGEWIDYVQLALFTILALQLSVGFSLAFLGFLQEILGSDDVISWPAIDTQPTELPATAVLVPIFNEDMDRISDRIRSMWKSLEKLGGGENFDLYLLSDSDQPKAWADEVEKWLLLVSELNGVSRIFYRRRRSHTGHKSGNIADFCRKWGAHYRYMIVLDADSLMTGKLMKQLVCAMESRPRAGIIQSIPQLVGGESFYCRIIQFASSLYGRLFIRGCSYWQMDAANYWGHNAIIRISAFMKHCDLPDLPPSGKIRPKIMSHDTIEAALMSKAGCEVWLFPNQSGSYEESPPNLMEALVRDRRWCHGNLQHVWFLFARNLDFSSRLHIAFGLLSYLASPLWLSFLVVGISTMAIRETRPFEPDRGDSLFLLLVLYCLILLFLPKLLATFCSFFRRTDYGGIRNILIGVCLEVVVSALLAPVIMLFHSLFVLQAFTGREVSWNSQNRDTSGISWKSSFRIFGWVSLFGLITATILMLFLPGSVPWLSPILLSWILAVPVARWTSLSKAGKKIRQIGVLSTPEEIRPAEELRDLYSLEETRRTDQEGPDGFLKILTDPLVTALHIRILHQQNHQEDTLPPSLRSLIQRCLEQGPESLNQREKLELLQNVLAVEELHERLWIKMDGFMSRASVSGVLKE